jgi:pimeloyl-ACP methyl ester carboxylesterase
MPSKRGRLKPARPATAQHNKAGVGKRAVTGPQPAVSPRWLVSALLFTLVVAVICAWVTLCILFWQGSWQLLYHPSAPITRTPANARLAFDAIGFATNPAGEPQLRGWWIPAAPGARYTALYLHGADGNLGDTVSALARLHNAGMNVLAFDYRGYGQSHFEHPSESRFREDAEHAVEYLTGTRHVLAGSIVLVGKDLGANLALEVAAAHPELAGVVLEQPSEDPVSPIFSDPRSRLVPARLLVRDRYEPHTPASNLLIPSLWFYWSVAPGTENSQDEPPSYRAVPSRKTIVWLSDSAASATHFADALSSWLDDLPKNSAGH